MRTPSRSGSLDPGRRSPERLRAHYEIERELAARLRRSTREQRLQLYGQVYDELFERVSDHPQHTMQETPARVGQAAAAEDFAAEPFVRTVAARARFRHDGFGVRAWLFQIATNLLRDELRARSRRARAHGLREVADSAAAPGLPSDPAEAVTRGELATAGAGSPRRTGGPTPTRGSQHRHTETHESFELLDDDRAQASPPATRAVRGT